MSTSTCVRGKLKIDHVESFTDFSLNGSDNGDRHNSPRSILYTNPALHQLRLPLRTQFCPLGH